MSRLQVEEDVDVDEGHEVDADGEWRRLPRLQVEEDVGAGEGQQVDVDEGHEVDADEGDVPVLGRRGTGGDRAWVRTSRTWVWTSGT